jgi:hypothetical protein
MTLTTIEGNLRHGCVAHAAGDCGLRLLIGMLTFGPRATLLPA